MFITQNLNNATMLKNNKINDNKHKSFNKFTFFMLFYWLKNNICGAINLKQVWVVAKNIASQAESFKLEIPTADKL